MSASRKVVFRVAVAKKLIEGTAMPEGKIKRLTDKGFGFIDIGTGKDLFFHASNVEGVQYEDLSEGQTVTFVEGSGPKGPRAEQVRPA